MLRYLWNAGHLTLFLLPLLSFLIRLWRTLLPLPLGNLFREIIFPVRLRCALIDLHTFLLLLFDSGFVLAMFSEELIKSSSGEFEFVGPMKCSFIKIRICLREAVIILYDSYAIL